MNTKITIHLSVLAFVFACSSSVTVKGHDQSGEGPDASTPASDLGGGGSDGALVSFQCGDGKCEPGEDCVLCQVDCGECAEPHCGDGFCLGDEDCQGCPADCGDCGEEFCGNGACGAGENCATCQDDCGECAGGCGNGICQADETCESCPEDCEVCPVDAPLTVVITHPGRGEETDQSSMQVTGFVGGGTAPYSLTLNGAPVNLDGNSTFVTQVSAVHGMNLLNADVSDGAGASARTIQAFYYSTYYYPIAKETPDQSMVQDALAVILGPEVWDDDDPSDLDDIASVIILFVKDQDLGALIDNPVDSGEAGWCDYEIAIDNVGFGDVDVDITPVDGGLFVHIDIKDFHAHVDADLDGIACPGVSGTVTADSITIDATFWVSDDGQGGVTISSDAPAVGIHDLKIEFDNDILDFLVGWLVNWFLDVYTGQIEEMFEDELKDQINATITQTIESLAWEQTIDIPIFFGMGTGFTVTAVMSISTVLFSPKGARVGIQATVVTNKGTKHESPGALSMQPCPKESGDPFTSQGAFGIALHDDLVNQIPYSLFWGGLFPVDVPLGLLGGVDLGDLGLGDLGVTLDMLLPPIISDCQKDDYVLQMGDFLGRIQANYMGMNIALKLYAHIEVAIELTLVDGPDGKEIGAGLTPTKLDIDVADVKVQGFGQEEADSLKALLDMLLNTQVIDALGQQIFATMPLPAIELGGLHSSIPLGAKLKIDPQLLDRKWGYIVFEGGVKTEGF
jgi:hypothetical protein